MAFVDTIEELGRAVEDGEISKEQAVQDLVAVSGGGITEVGAGGVLDSWRTSRFTYESAFDQARDGRLRWLNDLWCRS